MPKKKRKSGGFKAWSKIRNRELKDPEFARHYLLAAIEEGLDLKIALKDVIGAVGPRKYARWVKGMDHPNLIRAVRQSSNPTVKTLEKILRPLGLQLAIQEAK